MVVTKTFTFIMVNTPLDLVRNFYSNFISSTKYFTQKYPQCLVLATEIKKVYCNESNGEIFPLIVDELKEQLKNAILRNAMYFCKKKCNLNVNGKYHFVVGGRKIEATPDVYAASDVIEIGEDKKIPLWLFGFLY